MRRLHLLLGRQIDPQLKAAHAALALLRHFRMDDAARGGHPLYVAGRKVAAVAEVILVPHVTVEHVGDGLEAAMRGGREAGDVILRIVRVELIEHQERIDLKAALTAQTAAELDAGAVRGRYRWNDLCQGTHWVSYAARRSICAAALASPAALVSAPRCRPSA